MAVGAGRSRPSAAQRRRLSTAGVAVGAKVCEGAGPPEAGRSPTSCIGYARIVPAGHPCRRVSRAGRSDSRHFCARTAGSNTSQFQNTPSGPVTRHHGPRRGADDAKQATPSTLVNSGTATPFARASSFTNYRTRLRDGPVEFVDASPTLPGTALDFPAVMMSHQRQSSSGALRVRGHSQPDDRC
jgi:hypothetical protein